MVENAQTMNPKAASDTHSTTSSLITPQGQKSSDKGKQEGFKVGFDEKTGEVSTTFAQN